MHNRTRSFKQRQRPPTAKSAWRRLILGLLACLLVVVLLGSHPPATRAKATRTPQNRGYNPYDVIAAVNAVRAANGLPAYQANGALMAAAQAHSEYQAATGSITHIGQGGSDVKSRALAAGYGGGSDVSVIENIYGGTNASPQQAVQWWQGDSLHLSTLLSTRHTDVGAGIATSGDRVYYTLDVGSVSGNPLSLATPVPGGSTAQAPVGTVSFYPFSTATPHPDGAIVHVVQAGQTLWMIAAVYNVSLAELLRINGLYADNIIVPGQKILIRQAGSVPTESYARTPPTDEATGTPRQPRPTRTPTMLATPQAMLQPAGTASLGRDGQRLAQGAKRAGQAASSLGFDPLLAVIGLLVIGGVVLIVMGSLLKRR